MRPRKKGFTLIEMIVVVAILVIIAAAIIPQIINTINKSRAGTDIANGRIYAEEIAKEHLEGKYTLGSVETAIVPNRISNDKTSKLKKKDNKFWYRISFDLNEKYEIVIFVGGDNASPIYTGEDANVIYPVVTGEWAKYKGN